MTFLKEQFHKDGYIIVKGLLEPEQDILPLKETYSELLDALARIYLVEANSSMLSTYDGLSLPERFAVLLGASGGTVLHHLDPVLNILVKTFQWRKDLPNPRIPEIFTLMCHAKVLDIIEQFVGPEIAASPIYHFNFKLSLSHLKLANQVAESIGTDLSEEPFYTFQVGETRWHTDALYCLRDSHKSHIVNAWIPITHATEENSCLLVVPESHKDGVRYGPYPEDLVEQAIPLPVELGDVVFLNNKLIHSSTQNTSRDDYRWAFNFRYLPVGQPSGRPFLPGFVARSYSSPETELHNAYIWSTMWIRSLDYFIENGTPISHQGAGKISPKEAAEITKYWNELVPDVDAWLNLGKCG